MIPKQSLHSLIQFYNSKLLLTYPWYEDESEDHGGSQQQPHSHHSWVGIHIVPQSVGGDNDDSQHNTCDVHRGSNVHRVIQTLHLHIASTKSQEQSQDLQNAFVSKKNCIQIHLSFRFTNVQRVLVTLSCHLREIDVYCNNNKATDIFP